MTESSNDLPPIRGESPPDRSVADAAQQANPLGPTTPRGQVDPSAPIDGARSDSVRPDPTPEAVVGKAPGRDQLELVRRRQVQVETDDVRRPSVWSVVASLLLIGVVGLAGYVFLTDGDSERGVEVAGVNRVNTGDSQDTSAADDGDEAGSIEAGVPFDPETNADAHEADDEDGDDEDGNDEDGNDEDGNDDGESDTASDTSDPLAPGDDVVDLRVAEGAIGSHSAELSVTSTPCVRLEITLEPSPGGSDAGECATDHAIRLDGLEPSTNYVATLAATTADGVGAVETIEFTTRNEQEPVPPSVSAQVLSSGRNEASIRVQAVPCVVIMVEAAPLADGLTGVDDSCKTTHEFNYEGLVAGTAYEVTVAGTSENLLTTTDVVRFTTAPPADIEMNIQVEASAEAAEMTITSSPCLDIEITVDPTGSAHSGAGNGCQTQHGVKIVGLDSGGTYSVTVFGRADDGRLVSRQVVLAGEALQGKGGPGSTDNGANESPDDTDVGGGLSNEQGDPEGDPSGPPTAVELAIAELAVDQTRATFIVSASPCADITVTVVPPATISGTEDPCQTRHQITLTDLKPGTGYAVEVVGLGEADGAEPVVAGSLFVTSPPPPPPAAEMVVSDVEERSATVTVRSEPCVSLDLRITSTELGTDRSVSRGTCETEHIVALGRDGDAELVPGVSYSLSALLRSDESSTTRSGAFQTKGVAAGEELVLTDISVTPVEGGVEVVFASTKCGTPSIRWFQAAARDIGGLQTAGDGAVCATSHRSLMPNLAPATDYVVNLTVVTPDGERGRRRLEFRTP